MQNPYLHDGEAPTAAFDIQTVVTAGMPIRELACPSHKVNVTYEGPSTAKVDLDKSEKHGGNRDYILRYRLDGDRIQSGILLYEGEKENFFLVTMQPPKSMKKTRVLDREYIFIVDVSGSMWGYPLDISKKLVKDLLGGLRPSDLFNVILFSGGSSIMAEQSVPASPENIKKAVSLIDRQQGGGGTELLPALKQALSLKKPERYARSIVVATDGFVEVEEEVFDLVRNNLGNANIFAFGIGTSVNRHIIEGMAEVGMGEPFIITKPEEAPSKAARFRAIIESPVLTGINLTFDGFAAYDVEPPHIPDVLSERPVTIFGKYRGKAARNDHPHRPFRRGEIQRDYRRREGTADGRQRGLALPVGAPPDSPPLRLQQTPLRRWAHQGGDRSGSPVQSPDRLHLLRRNRYRDTR